MTDDRPEHAEPLLIEWVAERLRFDRLAAALPGDLYPPYLLVAVGLFVEYGVLDVYNHFVTGKATFLTDPAALGIGVGVTLGVVGTRRLWDAYAEAVDDLTELSESDDSHGNAEETSVSEQSVSVQNSPTRRTVRFFRRQLGYSPGEPRDDAAVFVPLVSIRVRLVAYLVGLLIVWFNLFVFFGVDRLVTIEGVVVGVVSYTLQIPLVYLPLIVEVVVSCLGISLLFPRRIAHADLDLFYHDPRNLGGLESVGTALRRSYLLYTGGLLLYVVLLYLRYLLPSLPVEYPPPSSFLTLLFSALWSVGVVAVGYSVYRIHAFMKADKERRLDELEAAARRRVEASSDTYTEPELSPAESAAFQRRIDRVTATRTYPFGAVGSLRVGVGVLLPQALNLVLRQLFL